MTRTLLISLILFVGPVFADINVDYVSFVWDAAGSSGAALGGGATKAAWEAGSPSDFFETSTGAEIVNETGVTVQDSGGLINLEKTGQFADIVTGMIANIDFVAGAYDAIDGYWVVTKVTDNEITLDGSTYPGSDTTCTIIAGGTINGLGNIINSDLADASSVNCDVLIKGDETLGADVTLSGGGGTASTMLRFLGVDSSWVRIVPTRTSVGGGKANYLLKISDNHMPTFSLDANVEFYINVDYVQIDGLYFTGNSNTRLVGTLTGNYQMFSNSVFENAGTATASRSMETNNYCIAYNCDFLMIGATGASYNIGMDITSRIVNCRFEHASSAAAGAITAIAIPIVIGNIFYDYATGTGVRIENASAPGALVMQNTFEDIPTCVSIPDVSNIFLTMVVNNIAMNATVFVDNLYGGTAAMNILAMFNQLNNVTTAYDDFVGDLGFQDLTSDPLFVSEANDDYNLQATSPAKNSGPFLTNRGAMSDAEAAGAGGGQPVIGGSVVR